MTGPTVTIVVVAHSVRHELERCFASIRDHAGVPTKVILVDNASDDDTRDWVRKTHLAVDLVELDENLGVAARDHGLRRSTSPYTMFLDSDASLTPGALLTLVRALEENPDWGLVGPRLIYEDGTLQRSARRFPPLLLPFLRRPPLARIFEDRATVRRHLMADFDHAHTRPVLYVLGACQLFRTALARRAGPFDDRVFLGWDDADWCFRIRDAGGEIVFVSEAEAIHRYRRLTSRRPASRAALRQLWAFVYFQRMYRGRRKELIRLSKELDRRAGTGDTCARSTG